MILSIWLADDIRMGEGFRWAYAAVSQIAQSDLMVLANLEAYDRRMDVRIRPQAGQSNKSRGYFGGASLHQLLCTGDRDRDGNNTMNTTRSANTETKGRADTNDHRLPVATGKDASSGAGDGVGGGGGSIRYSDGLLLTAIAEWEASRSGFDNRDLATELVELTRALELDNTDDGSGDASGDGVFNTASDETNADRRQCVGEDGRMSSTCSASAAFPRKDSTHAMRDGALAHRSPPLHHHHHQHHQHPPQRHLPHHHHHSTPSSPPRHPLRALVVAGVSSTIVAEADSALRLRQSFSVRRDEINDYLSQDTILSKHEEAYVVSLINQLNNTAYAPTKQVALTMPSSAFPQQSGGGLGSIEGSEQAENSNHCNFENANVQDGR